MSYFESQSAFTAGYTQASTRINEVTASYYLDSEMGYKLDPGNLVNRRLPVETAVNVTFENNGTITIPILAKPLSLMWTDLTSYMNDQCPLWNATTTTASINKSINTTLKQSRQVNQINLESENTDRPCNSITTTDSTSRFCSGSISSCNSIMSSDPFNISLTPLASGSGIRAYQLTEPYQDIGVLCVGMFASDNSFSEALNQGLDIMNSSGVEKLIIDLSGNLGGNLTIGEYLQQTLFPDKATGFPMEIRAGQLAVKCSQKLEQLDNNKTFYNLYNYREYCEVPPQLEPPDK